jgi:O-antigen/teichoic acid export membrane protein
MKLRHDFSWTLIGNAIYAACQWGMLVAIAKLGSPEMLGQFTLGLAITAPILMFTNLHLRTVQVTDAKKQFMFGDYLALRIIGTTVGMLVILGLVASTGYRAETTIAIGFIALAKAFETLSDVCYGLLQQNEQMDRIARASIVKGLLSLLLMSLGLYLSKSIVVGAAGLALAWGLVLVCLDLPNVSKLLNRSPSPAVGTVNLSTTIGLKPRWDSRSLYRLAKLSLPQGVAMAILRFNFSIPRPRWEAKTLTKLAWLALPLGVVMMLASLYLNVPRYFIQNYLGEKELGIFGALSYLMVVGNIVINALSESASSRLAKYYADADRHEFGQLTFRLLAIFSGFGILGILFAVLVGKQALTLIYRAEYAQHQEVFVLLMLAAGIGYVSTGLGYAVTAAQYFRVQIPVCMAMTATSALVCLWLVPTQGMQGAAISLVTAATVQLVLHLGVITHALFKLKSRAQLRQIQ